mmetsp:Transcript_63748/g.194955  ORF Transcript_63748/g.194955 Transcript_63748/m.194955 type:complete len:235 (-) Transcript_63748:624-1328(-)
MMSFLNNSSNVSSSAAWHNAAKNSTEIRSGTWHTLIATSRIGLAGVSVHSLCQSGAAKDTGSHRHDWSAAYTASKSRAEFMRSRKVCHMFRGAKLILLGNGCHPSFWTFGCAVSASRTGPANAGHSFMTLGKSHGSNNWANCAGCILLTSRNLFKNAGIHSGWWRMKILSDCAVGAATSANCSLDNFRISMPILNGVLAPCTSSFSISSRSQFCSSIALRMSGMSLACPVWNAS